MPVLIDVVPEHELSAPQKSFVNLWSQEYFGQVAISQELESASVHWHLFLRQGEMLLSHVGITQYLIAVNGHPRYVGAIGGLFTVRPEMGKGHGHALMDAAERYMLDHLGFGSGILFCLPDLVPFYERRGWRLVRTPVTLEQHHGLVTWPESVMILSRDSDSPERSMIHVPIQPALRPPAREEPFASTHRP